ncbi:pleckstrin homology domain-containing family G member 5-like [Heptranchias perlo]|uniref:pleckstrin homology domain-containing family G member 5-like n=1 Tax=Heptranchias perlo TaxID=212740 RepID=UPI00355A51C9
MDISKPLPHSLPSTMSRFTVRTWDVPQDGTSPQPTPNVRYPEDFHPCDDEALDPGPLGLVAARIQLFDGCGSSRSRVNPSNPHLTINGAAAKGKGSSSLGYQSAAKKTRKNVPESSTLSKLPTSSSSLVEIGSESGRSRGTARLSGIFSSAQVSKDSEKVEELYQKLATFSLYGLPRLPDALRDHWEIREGEESRICLQDSWKDIVRGHEVRGGSHGWGCRSQTFSRVHPTHGRVGEDTIMTFKKGNWIYISEERIYRATGKEQGVVVSGIDRRALSKEPAQVRWAERPPPELRDSTEAGTTEIKLGMPAFQIATVENFIRGIDAKMQSREEQQKLAMVASRINLYDVVEGSSEEVERNVKDFSALDLTLPMVGLGPECIRQLLFEGSLKMRERKDSKIEVHCLLFTDTFLITKPLKKANRAKVIRQPLMLDKTIVRQLKDPGSFLLMYLNELHCVVAAFTFQASSSALCKQWTDCLSAAQKQLELLRSQEEWFVHQRIKQMEEGQETRGSSAPSSPVTPRTDPGIGETSSQSKSVGLIPRLVLWAPGEPEFGMELELDPEAPENEEGLVSSPSPRLGCPRSPRRQGAQRFIARRVRREKGPRRAQPDDDPETQAQASDRDEAEPEEGLQIQARAADWAQTESEEDPEIEAQASDWSEAGPEEGPDVQAQALDRCQAEPEEGSELQAQALPEVGPDLQAPGCAQAQPEEGGGRRSPGPGSVMEILRRAKAMDSRPHGSGSKVGDTVETENQPMTSSRLRTLTLAELQRIRSPLHLNSTLTTSEV